MVGVSSETVKRVLTLMRDREVFSACSNAIYEEALKLSNDPDAIAGMLTEFEMRHDRYDPRTRKKADRKYVTIAKQAQHAKVTKRLHRQPKFTRKRSAQRKPGKEPKR